ncbi:MAG: ribonuclease J [Candidatus Pacebacteria bacterium]|nr:ribonuclease J [Candidatus Paceibacterota bacterium]
MNTENTAKKNSQKTEATKTSPERRGSGDFKKRYNSQSHRKHKRPQGENRHHGSKKPHVSNKIPPLADGDIRVIPLGGVDGIGQNMNIVETKDDIFIIDIGIQFSSAEITPGVDYIIPNTKYLMDKKDKIRGVFVTHGHLDHIGAFPYIIDQLGYPKVYCGLLTKWFIDKKVSEFPHLKKLEYEVVEAGQRITVANMKVKVFAVTHSIPDALGFSFETEQGNIIFAGDTKLEHVDHEPVQREIDNYGGLETDTQKNLLFLSDSTSAEQLGWSKNEGDIIGNIIDMISEAKSRVFLGTFASQIVRITAIMEGAHKHGKKIILEGRSMKTNVEICIKSGIWTPPKGLIITADEARNLAPDKLVYLLTGSQGEEFAALMRISMKRHPKIRFVERDTVILSSSVIPGNHKAVRKLKDNLSRHGLRIVQYQTSDIHASGHGNQDELLWISKTINPKFFIPIHGHHSMLRAHAHAQIERNGFDKNNIIIPDNGSVIDVNKNSIKMHKAKAPNNMTVIEGFRVGDIQDVVIKDRKTLTQEGIFVVIATIDVKTGKLRKSPDIISRGFVYLRDSQELINEARNLVKKTITKTASRQKPVNFDVVKKHVTDDLSRFLVQNTGKRPIVIPVVLGI